MFQPPASWFFRKLISNLKKISLSFSQLPADWSFSQLHYGLLSLWRFLCLWRSPETASSNNSIVLKSNFYWTFMNLPGTSLNALQDYLFDPHQSPGKRNHYSYLFLSLGECQRKISRHISLSPELKPGRTEGGKLCWWSVKKRRRAFALGASLAFGPGVWRVWEMVPLCLQMALSPWGFWWHMFVMDKVSRWPVPSLSLPWQLTTNLVTSNDTVLLSCSSGSQES